MPRNSRSFCVGLLTLLVSVTVGMRASAEDVLAKGLSALASGSFDEAATTLADFVSKHPDDPTVATAMCGAGQALASMGRDAEALEFFEAALRRQSDRLREVPIRLSCARCAMKLKRYSGAVEHADAAIRSSENARHRAIAYPVLISALLGDNRATEAWTKIQEVSSGGVIKKSLLASLVREIGTVALRQGEAETAQQAFKWQLENDSSDQDAALGYAWAEAALASSPLEAAAALLKFVDENPRSRGAAHALLAAARKRIDADQHVEALPLLTRLADQYSDSTESAEALSLLAELADRSGDSKAARQARARLARDHLASPAAREVLHVALAMAADESDDVLFDQITATIFATGDRKLIQRTLKQLSENSGQEVVLRFAESGLQRMIDPTEHAATAPIVDWLFQHEQWSVIVDASSKLPTSVLIADPRQGSVIAESLYRTGRSRAAFDLYTRLASDDDSRKESPSFIVLLRHAELAVQIGSSDEAGAALRLASDRAKSHRDHQYIQIIGAQLAIRQANFEAARERLEAVVRSAAADDRLRGRAQWLIGETYFMQQQYSTAIDAYRRCESLFPDSGWAAASLLQAGKSFEKLGDFRDAAVCYTTLMKKHASTPYARTASSRLGAIGTPSLR